jgi:hypothetical protein
MLLPTVHPSGKNNHVSTSGNPCIGVQADFHQNPGRTVQAQALQLVDVTQVLPRAPRWPFLDEGEDSLLTELLGHHFHQPNRQKTPKGCLPALEC